MENKNKWLKKSTNKHDLIQYIPCKLKIGIYEYDVEIRTLKYDKEENEGECNFRDKKILLSDELCYDLSKSNWKLTIEVFLHEAIHAYNLNVGIHSGFFDFQNKKPDEIEEIFVDFHARHLVQLIAENPMVADLLNLLKE